MSLYDWVLEWRVWMWFLSGMCPSVSVTTLLNMCVCVHMLMLPSDDSVVGTKLTRPLGLRYP